ncbi:MAG: hypothetical protein ACREDR_35000 [Blastocatellia bacterium]
MTIAYERTLSEIGTPGVVESMPGLSMAAETPAAEESSRTASTLIANTVEVTRESGDEINRFLLCVLVSKSAKRIKEKAMNSGEQLATTTIVRSVLRSYSLAAKETPGLLAGPGLHLPSFRVLNGRILREQVKSSVKDRVRKSQARLDQANRLGDETRIRAEKEALARDVSDYDRLLGEFR